jgi:t-SNARE complex subunit (syntaxin)
MFKGLKKLIPGLTSHEEKHDFEEQDDKKDKIKHEKTVDTEPKIVPTQTIETDMQQLEKEIATMKGHIKDIDNIRSSLKETYNKSLTAITDDKNQKLVIQKEMKKLKDKLNTFKEELKNMKAKTEKMQTQQGLSAVVRIRETQYAEFVREFQVRKTKIEELKEQYDNQNKQRMTRTLRIIDQNITEDQVSEIIQNEDFSTADLFQKQFKGLTSTQKHTLDVHLSEAQETHRAVLEMERSMNEIHQMFKDFNMLLAEQDPMFDVISSNIARANDNIIKGINNTRDAKNMTATKVGMNVVGKLLPF